MRNSVCTRCGTSFLHAVDVSEVCPECENKDLRAEIERQRKMMAVFESASVEAAKDADRLRAERDEFLRRSTERRQEYQKLYDRTVKVEDVLRRVLDTPARRIVTETGTLRDWLPTRLREEADRAAGGGA